MRGIVAGFAVLISVSSVEATAGEILSYSFDPPLLDESIWCQCQITQPKTPVNLWRDPHDNVTGATITVNESSIGGKACEPECSTPGVTALAEEKETPENLGPPLFRKAASLAMTTTDGNPYCDEEAEKRGKLANQPGEDACSQRQELRLRSKLKFPSALVQTYAFRFRMPMPVLNKTDSIRWITAQWKQEPYHETKYKDALPTGASPVVAQRYDDGILWITVQSDLCRCVIAGASEKDTNGTRWKSGKPTDCISIDARKPAGSSCEPSLDVQYFNGGMLASPSQSWVEMKYVMKFSATDGSNFLEVYQGDRKILKATGMIGYEPASDKDSVTKFKIGIYRDYIPQEDMIDIDWIRASVDKK